MTAPLARLIEIEMLVTLHMAGGHASIATYAFWLAVHVLAITLLGLAVHWVVSAAGP